jgi:hypothetical protein
MKRSILGLGLAGLLALSAGAASAAKMEATYQGFLQDGGIADQGGFFGGGQLSGPITVVFDYDTSIGAVPDAAEYGFDEVSYGGALASSTSPMSHAAVTIGGATVGLAPADFGFVGTIASSDLIVHAATDGLKNVFVYGFLSFAPTIDQAFSWSGDCDACGRVVFWTDRDQDTGTIGDFTFTRLDIVRLDDAAGGVPEPATWALMIGGFGLAGASLRARRRLAMAQ